MVEKSCVKLLVLGARGQVGWELTRTLAPLGEVSALDRSALDATDLSAVRSTVRSLEPDIIVNAAAYTNVDGAETESALARRLNAQMPRALGEEAERRGALLIHYSTDYVFDGTSDRPYVETDQPHPTNEYGRSKLEGDLGILGTEAHAYIFRIGWVYALRGHNFVATIQRLARERDELRVVGDQYGSPTWAGVIAGATSLAINRWLTARRDVAEAPPRGVYHMAAPDSASWHDFASAIVASMPAAEGWRRPPVRSITTAEYPTTALRPARTVLDSGKLRDEFGLGLPPWRAQFSLCMDARP